MDRWRGRVALVTGGSAGIGAAITKLLCMNGLKVVACARRVEKIGENFGNDDAEAKKFLRPFQCDLSKPEDIKNMFKFIENEPDLGRVDICIANAGLSFNSSLLEGTVDEWRHMLDVNVIALNLCTQLAVKSMIKHEIDDGQIVMINSLSGHRVPFGTPTKFYSATKFAVTALLEGWRQEIRSLGKNHIRVAQVSPGLVSTEFAYKMNPEKPEKAETLYSSLQCIQADDIAQLILNILQTPIHVQIHDILVRPTEQQI